jgi:N-acetyl-anhydromuramyl-L-alanine amidase AmpD
LQLLREQRIIAGALAEASREFDVPLPILQGIAFVQSRYSHTIPWEPAPAGVDCPGCGARIHDTPSYGVMGLRDDEHFGRSLAQAAFLIGERPDILKKDPVANIRGAAALLALLANQERHSGKTVDHRLETWKRVVEMYSGIRRPDLAELFALDVFRVIQEGRHQLGVDIEAHPDLDMTIFTEQASKKKAQVASLPVAARYSGAVWMGPPASGNYEAGRRGNSIRFVIIHTTEGSAQSALDWFKNPASGASAHYIIKTDGIIWQVLGDQDTAYHAGNLTYNLQSIGIELEGWADGPDFSWQTNAQYGALQNLVSWLAGQYGIPLDRSHLIGHNQIPGVAYGSCAGPSSWGGCRNHHDPGAWWSWRRLMTGLGRSPNYSPLVLQTSCSVHALPQSGAPQITSVSSGEKFVAYDYYAGYHLIFLSGREAAQPYLGAGEYHWDAWLPSSCASASPGLTQLEVARVFPGRLNIRDGTLGSSTILARTIDGKRYAATGNTQIGFDGHTWYEYSIAWDSGVYTRGWSSGAYLDVIGMPEAVSMPNSPSGPTSGTTGVSYAYSTGGSSSNLGHSVQYLFDWGDGTNSGWLPVGQTSASHSWSSAGTYTVRAKARCATHTSVESGWSSGLTVSITGSVGVPNDEPAGASLITSLPYNTTQNTQPATSSPADPVHSCTGRQDSNTVWFRYVASFTGLLRVTSFGSNYNTVLSAYPGTTSPGAELACNDDAGGTLQSEIRFNVSSGQSYLIQVSQLGSPGGGTLVLNVTGELSRTPTAVLRDTNGSIRLTRLGSTTLYNGGGVFASDPGAAQNANGDTFVVARDNYNALWASVFNAGTLAWGSWSYGAGVTKGTPAIAVVASGTAYIAARDNWNSYWLISYAPGVGFGQWTPLGGIFATDPVMCAAPDGSLYLIGKDTWNSLWSGRYIPGTGFQGWQWGMGVVKGKPSVACGTDGAAYVAVRDSWDSLWMARVSGNSWTGWHYGGGIMSADPQAASAGAGVIYAVIRDPWGGIWYRGFTEGTGANWQSWTFTVGILQDFSPAGLLGELYIAGRDGGNNLWWYRLSSGWTWADNAGLAAGPLSAAPR